MWNRHDIPALPSPLVAEASEDEVRVRLPDGQQEVFQLLWVRSLTRQTVADVLGRVDPASERRIFISYQRSSPEARDALRDAGVSFAGDDGRVFVRAPGIFVDRDEPPSPRAPERGELRATEDASVRNPFAKRSSRVPRWLLLHHEATFSPSELASAVDLNPASVSRLLSALEDAALVREAKRHARGRRRSVRLERPRALLDAWLPLWQRRRIRQLRWDVGAPDVDDALSLLTEAIDGRRDGWAIGGLAGAAMVRRAVEPAEVLVWTDPDGVEALARVLQPEPTRGRRGAVRIAIAPDPWTLRLARSIDGLPIADPVQLWLDCASEGERALEAADAVAEVAGWS